VVHKQSHASQPSSCHLVVLLLSSIVSFSGYCLLIVIALFSCSHLGVVLVSSHCHFVVVTLSSWCHLVVNLWSSHGHLLVISLLSPV
jgi:hypothetical protein